MEYNPRIHHRRSIRLRGHDYSQAGAYFITICCHNRHCMFGNIPVVGAGFTPAPTTGKLWQRNYYEHLIRNEQSYQTISNYILNNPAKWNEDKFFVRGDLYQNDIELHSYIKYKRFGIECLPDYTKKIDD